MAETFGCRLVQMSLIITIIMGRRGPSAGCSSASRLHIPIGPEFGEPA